MTLTLDSGGRIVSTGHCSIDKPHRFALNARGELRGNVKCVECGVLARERLRGVKLCQLRGQPEPRCYRCHDDLAARIQVEVL